MDRAKMTVGQRVMALMGHGSIGPLAHDKYHSQHSAAKKNVCTVFRTKQRRKKY